MTHRRMMVLGLFLWLWAGSQAWAHFLFIHIGPPAEGGRRAEVFFSEYAEAGDTRFIEKIAGTQLWLQTTPGKFQALSVHQGEDRLRALVPPSGSMVVVGSCTYGVLSRKVPFLLRHYPKAMAGNPEELGRMQAFAQVPLEIVATIKDEGLRLVALRKGKPFEGAEFHTVARDLSGEKLKAGADGSVTWKPPKPGRYAVYTSHYTKVSGKLGDKKYDEIRDFATLAFTWPLVPAGADPAATALFQDAIQARAGWKGFPGFHARIEGKVGGRPFKGTATIEANGEITLLIDDEVVQPWVEGQLESIVLHRKAGSSGPGKLAFRFADDEVDHPLGRLILVEGGRFASSYRIKDKQIMTVNRHMGKEIMTILVQENERNKEGLFLPRAYLVQYWDAGTGNLRRIETIKEGWQRFGAWDLPASHTEISSWAGGIMVRSFTLSGHKLLKGK